MSDPIQAGAHLGDYLPGVEAAVSALDAQDVVARIWRQDFTVWKDDPTEIADRLGWLAVTDTMRNRIPELEAFAAEVRDAGYQHVVLLGMGGSSLGPEVLRRAFGSAAGYPELVVLDSTVPAWVQAVTDAIDPAKTLFLVSSKSGSTIEPNTFYVHFGRLVSDALGEETAGASFVAITDPGTPLEKLARERGFRRAFLNPPDIGGRYSVLSYFGLVPAALMGLDLNRLLDRADAMRECVSAFPAKANPGAWLGAVMSSLSQQGRDKLTLIPSPSIAGFGLWVEQLLAESLGKQGAGIVPITASSSYGSFENRGSDRFFVYLRMQDDANDAFDARVNGLAAAGHPVMRLELSDVYDLGAEFYRWEFATAVAGSLLGVHPFDQPDVQGAKDMTDRVLDHYQASGALPALESAGSLGDLLGQARPGDYLAIMAYLFDTPEVSAVLDLVRERIAERYKGGAGSGLFLQLTADHLTDIPIPGRPYTFGTLADAQAAGDLQALQELGRRTARVHLNDDPAAGLKQLLLEL